jgi:uncharacterized protein YbaR (Trm112 family)
LLNTFERLAASSTGLEFAVVDGIPVLIPDHALEHV